MSACIEWQSNHKKKKKVAQKRAVAEMISEASQNKIELREQVIAMVTYVNIHKGFSAHLKTTQ